MLRDWLRRLRGGTAAACMTSGVNRRTTRKRSSQSVSAGDFLESRVVLSATAFGSEQLVNAGQTTGSQQTSDTSRSVAMDADGDYVVVWQSTGDGTSVSSDIWARRYLSDGTPIDASPFRVNTSTAASEVKPSVAMDADGDFVVTWASGNGSNDDIKARRFSLADLPGGALSTEITVNTTTTGRQANPVAGMDITGRFVIAWQDQGGTSLEVRARRFDADGNAMVTGASANDFPVNTTLPGNQRNPAVSMGTDGSFVIAWESLPLSSDAPQDTSGAGVYFRKFDASGVGGSEVQANVTTTNDQQRPSVAMSLAGDFVVSWDSGGVIGTPQDGNGAGIFARRFSSTGTAISSEIQVNTFTIGEQTNSTVAMDANGDFVITWESAAQDTSGLGVYGKQFLSTGVANGPEFRVSTFSTGDQKNASVAISGSSSYVATWSSTNQDGNLDGVYLQRYLESPDTAGALITDINDGTGILTEGKLFVTGPTAVDFTFTENLAVSGAGSVTDASNWQLLRDGIDVSTLIQSITFGLNSSRKYHATVTFSSALTGGDFVLTAKQSILDIAGNQLDGNNDGTPGGSVSRSFKVTNKPPVVNDQIFSVDEESPISTIIGNVIAADPDLGQSLTWSISGPGAAPFSIDPSTGLLTVINSAAIDYETTPTFTFQVQVTDSGTLTQPALSDTASITVNLNDILENTAPTAVILADSTRTLTENTATSTRIMMTRLDVDDDGHGINHFSLSGDDSEYFEIEGNTLYLKAGTVLDFEVQPSFSVSVDVDDTTVGLTPDASALFTLTLSNALDATAGSDTFTLIYNGTAPTGSVQVLLSTNGGLAVDQGIYSMSGPLIVTGLNAADLVQVRGSSIADVFAVTSAGGISVNGASLNAAGGATVSFDGLGGDDTYRFDADNALGRISVSDSVGGTDLLDFAPTTLAAVRINLSQSTTQTVNSFMSLTLPLPESIENVTGGSLADTITGNAQANTLSGGAGNDTLTGLAGDDLLRGGAGNDSFIFDADSSLGTDTIDEAYLGGTDTLDFSTTTTQSISVNSSTAASQVVNPNLSLILLNGFVPVTLAVAPTIENVTGGALSDILTGNSLANALIGNGGDDNLSGQDGNDRFTGGLGNDTITGGAGDDVYSMDADLAIGTDTIVELDGITGGKDLLDFSLTTLKNLIVDLTISNVAQVVSAGNCSIILSTASAIEDVTGGRLLNTLTGNAAANTLTAGTGVTTLSGGDGDDIYILDADTSSAITIVESVSPTGGKDTLDFRLTTTKDLVIDLSNANVQTIATGFSIHLGSDTAIENLTGGSRTDRLTGNSLANVINGGPGASTLTGSSGDDIYLIDADVATSTVIDESGGGNDSVDFTLTTTKSLAVNLGQGAQQTVATGALVTLGSASAIENVTGGAMGDTLMGNELANLLSGGAGNDIYEWNPDSSNGADTLTDSSGTDTINFSAGLNGITFSLGTSSVQPMGSGSITLSSITAFENIIGTGGNDTITGNSLGNSLIGGPGNDILSGAAGNDVYPFDADLVTGDDVLNDASGADTITFEQSTAAVLFNLGSTTSQAIPGGHITLGSASAFENLFGGSGADTLTGNSAANILDGAGGNDTIQGAAGNDTYRYNADSAFGSDTVSDQSGIDTISFADSTLPVNFSLGATTNQSTGAGAVTLTSGTAFENLTGGSGVDVLTGNSSGNVLTGNGSADTLNGENGDDTLSGGAGNDTLSGGLNNDTYVFDTDLAGGLGSDTVVDIGGVDFLDFSQTTTVGQGIVLDLSSDVPQSVNANLTMLLTSGTEIEGVLGTALDDIIIGNSAANVLVGNAGNDQLSGGIGNDILIGGLGADVLSGGADEDILIGGRTSFDALPARLVIIRNQWSLPTAYATRVSSVKAGIGSPVTAFKTGAGATVLNDGAVDSLNGDGGLDWYFKALDDAFDGGVGEIVDAL